MKLGAGVPVWVLRGGIVIAIGLIVLLLRTQHVAAFPVLAIATFGILSALAPASPAPAFVIVATAVSAATSGTDPFALNMLALLPLIHLVHIGSAISATVPATARVHPSALRPAALRFILVQASVFAIAAVAAIVPATVTPTALEVAGLAGVAVLAALAARLVTKR